MLGRLRSAMTCRLCALGFLSCRGNSGLNLVLLKTLTRGRNLGNLYPSLKRSVVFWLDHSDSLTGIPRKHSLVRSFLKSVFPYLLSFVAFLLVVTIYWHHNVIETARFPSHFTSFDAYHLYLPFYTYTAESLASLDIPLWNPYQMCGMSYIGVLQGAVFYPPVYLFALVSPPKAYSIYLMLHIAVGGFFVLLLCRTLGISWLSSWAGALTFMLCSNTVEKIFGPAFLANSIYLPLMFLFVLKIFETGRMKWALALTMASVLPLLAGWVQALVYSFYALALFSAAIMMRQLWSKSTEPLFLRRGLLLILWSVILFLLLTSIQTLPVIETGRLATRSFGKLSEEMLTIDNSAMYDLFRLVYDTFNSKGDLLPFHLYVGAVPLILSVFALWNSRLRFFAVFFWGLAIGAMILSTGPQTPLFTAWLYLPFTRMFRAPFRILFLHAVSLSVLCSIGLDRLLQCVTANEAKGRRRMVSYLALGGIVVCVLLLYVWPASDAAAPSVMKVVYAASRWRIYLLLFSLLILLSAGIPKPARAGRYLVGFGCIGLIAVDLFRANHNLFFLPEKNPRIYEEHSHIVEMLKSLTNRSHSRVFIAADNVDYSYCIKLGQLSKLFLINDYENMNPMRYNRFCNYMFGKNDDRSRDFFWGWFNLDDKLVHPGFFNLMSAEYLWFSKEYLENNSKSAMTNYLMLKEFCDPIYEDNENAVFFNPRALPRAYIVGESRFVSDEEEILRILSSAEFVPDREVIISDSAHQRGRAGETPASTASEATIHSLKPEEIRIHVRLDGDGFLVLTDQDFPGWEATIDDVPTTILRANYLFRCVPLTPGEHEVVFRYRPRSFRLGVALSFLGLILLVGSFIAGILRHRMEGSHTKE